MLACMYYPLSDIVVCINSRRKILVLSVNWQAFLVNVVPSDEDFYHLSIIFFKLDILNDIDVNKMGPPWVRIIYKKYDKFHLSQVILYCFKVSRSSAVS